MRLELFDVRRRWPIQRTQHDDERGFVNSGILFSLSSSVQFVGLILPSNSHAEIKTRLYASAIFPISGDWDVLLPSGVSPWNSIFRPGQGSKYNITSFYIVSKGLSNLLFKLLYNCGWVMSSFGNWIFFESNIGWSPKHCGEFCTTVTNCRENSSDKQLVPL